VAVATRDDAYTTEVQESQEDVLQHIVQRCVRYIGSEESFPLLLKNFVSMYISTNVTSFEMLNKILGIL